MGGIPPELTSSFLTALMIGGGWLATVLARKGKREDTRIAENNQSWTQIRDLVAELRAEVERLGGALAAARAETDRVGGNWEARWGRQMDRCRRITDSLAAALVGLLQGPGEEASKKAQSALQAHRAHNQDDHPA